MTDLVLIPGLNNTKAVWDGVVAALPGVHFHALDCPALESVEALADHFLAQLPPRFALAGFSFGGYVALAMLEKAPERIERIAMVASNANADPAAALPMRQKAIEAAEGGGYAEFVAAQAQVTVHASSLQKPELMAARLHMTQNYGPVRFAAHLRASIVRPDRNAVLQNCHKPVLVVCGDDDRVIPVKLQQKMAEATPGARFVLIPEAGHMMPLEKPAALAAALRDWLNWQQAETRQ